jgi:ribonuclease HII
MHIAIKNLNTQSFSIIDGNKFNSYPEISHDLYYKRRQKFMNIAAASIIAKTKRDEIMKKLSLEHPEYFGIKIKVILQKT